MITCPYCEDELTREEAMGIASSSRVALLVHFACDTCGHQSFANLAPEQWHNFIHQDEQVEADEAVEEELDEWFTVSEEELVEALHGELDYFGTAEELTRFWQMQRLHAPWSVWQEEY